ncbi:hypothetical protein [Nocardia bhagyanarayanae]|uniref:hypothetical protein n=1 Tax=Nocardia bhagyanarayanae TaxID=1215925 RepID=UPI001154A958|nr:hypothetical protein [Nocardia bhagyanarayanae]
MVGGVRVLSEDARASMEAAARRGGVRGWWARLMLSSDDHRRANAARRADSDEDTSVEGSEVAAPRLTDRGYRGRGGGRASVVAATPEWRATTTQVAGLWPFAVGASAPIVGTPIGTHYVTGAPVHFDPMSWFLKRIITAPTAFVLALNGFGKSSLIRRIITGRVAAGDTVLAVGDTKPDYRELVHVLGGQVISVGYGQSVINPLDVGALGQVISELDDPAHRRQIAARVQAAQVTIVAGLIELVRGARVADYEEVLLAAALRVLYDPDGGGFTHRRPPVLSDLLTVISTGSDSLAAYAEEDSAAAYRETTKPLRRSLRALIQGPFGEVFDGPSSVPLDLTRPAVCIDVSGVPEGDTKLLAAVLMVCWSTGFGAIAAAHTRSDAGLAPPRLFGLVMDEIWRVLSAGGDYMVDRVDALTRLQRELGTWLIMCSHTLRDLQSFNSASSQAKGIGLFDRARAKIIGPVGPDEIDRIRGSIGITETAKLLVTSWAAPRPPGEDDFAGGYDDTPPGMGCFLIMTGESSADAAGIPVHLEFTASERRAEIHNTNRRFDHELRRLPGQVTSDAE